MSHPGWLPSGRFRFAMATPAALGCCLLLSAHTAYSQAAADRRGEAPRQLRATEYHGDGNCSFDRVLASPVAGRVAIWTADDRNVLGSRTAGLLPSSILVSNSSRTEAGSVVLREYAGSGLRAFPVRWSADGSRLHIRIREREQRLVEIDAAAGTLAELGGIDAAWARVDLAAIRHGDVALLQAPATTDLIRRIDGTRYIRGSVTLGQVTQLIGVSGSSLELFQLTSGREVPLGINGAFTRSLVAFPDASHYRHGLAFVGAETLAGGAYLPYQMPLLDLETGAVIGRFSPARVELRNTRRLAAALEALRHQLDRDGAAILDASASGATLVVLTRSGRAARQLHLVSEQGLASTTLCARVRPGPVRQAGAAAANEGGTGDAIPASRIFALGPDGAESARPGNPVLMVHSVGPTSPAGRDALVYFHGGPGSSLLDWPARNPVARMLSTERDVIEVEYAGSQGGGLALSRRLAEGGVEALEQDVDALARWLGQQRYRRVFVIGTSFGGVPAMVAVSRHRDLFEKAFFIAPALRWREPEEWTGRRGLASINPVTQRAYEHAFFGGEAGRRRFAADLRALVARAPLRGSDLFFFGELDPNSGEGDLPPGTQSRVRVFPRANHEFVDSQAALWDDIRSAVASANPDG